MLSCWQLGQTILVSLMLAIFTVAELISTIHFVTCGPALPHRPFTVATECLRPIDCWGNTSLTCMSFCLSHDTWGNGQFGCFCFLLFFHACSILCTFNAPVRATVDCVFSLLLCGWNLFVLYEIWDCHAIACDDFFLCLFIICEHCLWCQIIYCHSWADALFPMITLPNTLVVCSHFCLMFL